MNFQSMMQAGPVKANELFARLAATSDDAVRTRERLFAELGAELDLHAGLEEEHLFPILRRNAETKALVATAIRDNKDLRARLAGLEALPKGDEAFLERLSDLQKAFRQHARDERNELLPAVQHALSGEEAQEVAGNIETSRAPAEQAKPQAGWEGATEYRAVASNESFRQATEDVIDGARRIGTAVFDAYTETARTTARDLWAVAGSSGFVIGGMTEIRSAWMEWLGETTRTGTQMSQQLLQQVVEGQREFAAEAMQGWMEHNARVMQIALGVAQEGLRPPREPPARSDPMIGEAASSE